jgi:hypothetical protein
VRVLVLLCGFVRVAAGAFATARQLHQSILA